MTPTTTIEHLGDRIVTLEGLFSASDCDALVKLAEKVGFESAPITTGRGFVMMPEIRNNTRVMLDDPPRSEALWRQLHPWTPPRAGWGAIGLNERLRFYRYGVGEYFRWHRDGAFCRDRRERSLLTVMVYLNEDFDGGATDFDVAGGLVSIVPKRGMVLLFDHELRHQGAPVRRGRKYVLRSDVMFRRDADRRR